MEAPVPRQVADRLRGRAFKHFDDFRHAFWQAAVAVPELASQFSAANRRLMTGGEAPKAPPAEQTAESSIFHLLHIDQRPNAYDVDGMRIFSPLRYHQTRHYGGLRLERGTWTVESDALRQELVSVVQKLTAGDKLSGDEAERLSSEFEDNVLYPYAADLIFDWRHEFRDAAELVDFVLGHATGGKLTRNELVEVARRLMTADVANAVQSERLSRQFKSNIPHPEGDGLIFYPKVEFRTPEELVGHALAYKP